LQVRFLHGPPLKTKNPPGMAGFIIF